MRRITITLSLLALVSLEVHAQHVARSQATSVARAVRAEAIWSPLRFLGTRNERKNGPAGWTSRKAA